MDLLLVCESSKCPNSSSQLCQQRDLIEARSQYRLVAKLMLLMSPLGNSLRIHEPSSRSAHGEMLVRVKESTVWSVGFVISLRFTKRRLCGDDNVISRCWRRGLLGTEDGMKVSSLETINGVNRRR